MKLDGTMQPVELLTEGFVAASQSGMEGGAKLCWSSDETPLSFCGSPDSSPGLCVNEVMTQQEYRHLKMLFETLLVMRTTSAVVIDERKLKEICLEKRKRW